MSTPTPTPTTHHVVVGAGGIGSATALRLAAEGHTVTLVSRSGRGPDHPLIERAALDLSAPDAAATLADLADGAASLVNAVNPSAYTHWDRDWPPMAAAFLAAAERSGAGLITVSNLYGHGPGSGVMTEATPLRAAYAKGRIRAEMWRDALTAHEAGRLRATELRASDYFGPGATKGMSYANEDVIGPAAAGRTVRNFLGRLDVPHTWTHLPDIATLAATLATGDNWGRAWLVPSAPPRTIAELAADAARAAGAPAPTVTMTPGKAILQALVPTLRATRETEYQFAQPFVIDASVTERELGLAPTPWEEALAVTVEALSPRRAA